MNSLTLNKYQEECLLEMIKVLFPELIAPTIQPNGYINVLETGDNYEDLIHWFEFSWVLLNRILEKETSPISIGNDVLNLGIICFNGSEISHPIDFIYRKYYEINKK
jgi:hypothetical protein